MPTIRVRAKPGRIAREAPDGAFIPEDRFVPVSDTFYIQRLINHHGDLEVEPVKQKQPEVVPEAEPEDKPKPAKKKD